MPAETARSKRLLTDDKSNVLIYMTGHGGDNFLKFQDTEEINSHDLADALQQMFERRRYKQVLLLIDTCQASTMHEHLRAPGVTAIASSVRGESSYSYQVDDELGVAVLDRFTWALLQFTAGVNATSNVTLADLYESLDADFLHSHPHLTQTEGAVDTSEARLVDFFGNVRRVQLGGESVSITDSASVPKWTTQFSLDKRDLQMEGVQDRPLASTLFELGEPTVSPYTRGLLVLGIVVTYALLALASLLQRSSNK